jgi:two-component system cell cycle response regulator DivK
VSNAIRPSRSEIERRQEPAHVLLVDASPDSLEMYAQWCCHVGLTALTATDPSDALTLARQDHPQAIVADVRIRRGFDGLELFERLRCDPLTADIPRLVLTGFITAAARELAELSGCQAFLLKPCAPERLVEEIARALRHQRATAPLTTTARRAQAHHRTRRFA